LLFHFVDGASRNVSRRLRRFAQGPKHFEVIRQRLPDAGILNLYGDPLALTRDGEMNLAQRCSSKRLGFELLEYLFGFRPEALLELRAHQRWVHGRRFHLQGRQFCQGFIRQSSGLQAQGLTELHRRATQRFHFVCHAPRGARVGRLQFRLALRFAEEGALQRVAEIAAGHAHAEVGNTQRAADRSVVVI
jgi:hypothetical protein